MIILWDAKKHAKVNQFNPGGLNYPVLNTPDGQPTNILLQQVFVYQQTIFCLVLEGESMINYLQKLNMSLGALRLCPDIPSYIDPYKLDEVTDEEYTNLMKVLSKHGSITLDDGSIDELI